jgi:putative ABC transport system permease protein
MANKPSMTLTAVLTLGLAMGATTGVFTMVNAILLRPLPYPHSERMVYIKEDYGRAGVIPFAGTAEFLVWKSQSRTVPELAAYINSEANLTGAGDAERVTCGLISESFLPLLGVQPLIGRNFSHDEDRPDAPPVAILSYSLWARRFGKDRGVVGHSSVVLDSKAYTIIGVLPEQFQVADRYSFKYDVWLPLALSSTGPNQKVIARVVGRLAPDARLSTALTELDTLLQANVKTRNKKRVVISFWQNEIAGGAMNTLGLLLAASGLVLLIATVNVACLLFAHATARRTEVAVRLALGAEKARVVRQFLTESILMAVAGALIGLVLGVWAKDLLIVFMGKSLPMVGPITLDLRVLAFTFALAILTGIAFGLLPGIQASGTQLNACLREAGNIVAGTRSRHRLSNILIVVEVATAMVVLVVATLLIRSYVRVRGIDPGFHTAGLLCLTIDATGVKYATPADQSRFFQRVSEQVKGLPGVESVGLSSILPLGFNTFTMSNIAIEGRADRIPSVNVTRINPDYFNTIRLFLKQGRNFSAYDVYGAPGVVIVNEAFARAYCDASQCIGKRVGSWIRGREAEWLSIIGVVGDIRLTLEKETSPELYTSYQQDGGALMSLVVRSSEDPTRLAGPIRVAIAAVDHDLPVHDVMSMEALRAKALAPRRMNMVLLTVLGALALALAAIGVYGLLSYSVGQRTHEIGIRLALGARPSQVVAMVLRRGLLLAGIGVILGIAGAFATRKLISSMMFQVGISDLASHAAAALIWILTSALACYLPARRAARIEPLVALRHN